MSIYYQLISNIFWSWWDKFFNNNVKLLSHYVSIHFFDWTHFLFSFRLPYLSTQFLSFDPFDCYTALNLHFTFHLVLEFLFFALFWILRMLVTMNKAKFSPQKSLITLVMNVFTSWKTLITFNMLTYIPTLLPLLLFSLKHMTCPAFTCEVSDRNKYFSRNFLQCVRIKPHSCSLTNVENSRSNFRQSVHICCKKKEENNGNCKGFFFL